MDEGELFDKSFPSKEPRQEGARAQDGNLTEPVWKLREKAIERGGRSEDGFVDDGQWDPGLGFRLFVGTSFNAIQDPIGGMSTVLLDETGLLVASV